MQEKDIVEMELKICEDKISENMNNLNVINKELQELQLTINYLISLVLNREKQVVDISLIFDVIKQKLIFMEDEMSSFESKIKENEIKTLWELLRIVQDFYSDKENEKINLEEELKHLRLELQNILDVLKEDKKGKRL